MSNDEQAGESATPPIENVLEEYARQKGLALEYLVESTGNAAHHYGIQRSLILTVTRGDYSALNLSTLLQAYEDLGRPKDVVGPTFTGDEGNSLLSQVTHPMFREAKERYGFGITIHAGETGRVEKAIRAAVELLSRRSDRPRHGCWQGSGSARSVVSQGGLHRGLSDQ